jgi:hypothetical protein
VSESGKDDGFLTRRSALLLFALVLVLRLSIVAQFHGNFDSRSFMIAAEAALHGENVYRVTNRYNYSPLWAYVVGSLWSLADYERSRFVLLIGLLQTAIDVGAAALIGLIAARRLALSPGSSRRAALLFFSNPISVLISGAHGQFDGIAVLCLLGGIYWAMDSEFARKRGRVVALLSLSLLVKHVTAFHPLLFWQRIRGRGLSDAGVAATYIIFFLSFVPFVGAWEAIARNVFLYSAGVERSGALRGGLQGYLGLSGAHSGAFAVLLFLAVAWILWITRTMALPRACLMLFLTLIVFLPSYAAQYLVWPLALGSLYPSAAFGLYTAAGAIWHSSESLEIQWPIRVAPYGAWLAALLWLVEGMRARARERQSFGGPFASSN